MFNVNILKMMYKRSPMNFYTFDNETTVIKSVNNTSLGYKFERKFGDDEINKAWGETKICKRWSTILIFLLLITLLYQFIFPKFFLFVNNVWYVNAIIILAIFAFVCQIITKICTIFFERNLKKKFGEFEKTIFKSKKEIDEKYYKLFKIELVKALILILVILGCFSFGSPLKKAQKLIEYERYNEAIKLTTLGSKIFPIAQEWYSLRGYAKFKIGDFDGAISDYDKAYNLGADGFNIMNFDNKIYIKYYTKDFGGALRDFDAAIEAANNDNERDQFMWDKAQFLYHIKNYEDALTIYTDLIDNADEDRIYLLKDRLYLERAQVYKALGQNELAQEDIINSGINDEDSQTNPIPQPTLMPDSF